MSRFVPSPKYAVLAAAFLIATVSAIGANAARQRSTAPASGVQVHGGPAGPTARALITTSIYGLKPLLVLYSAVGSYYLRITYDLPCTSTGIDLTARVSTSSRNVDLNGDDIGYINEWSTQNGGGPSGQQIACGSGHITTNDFAPADWTGGGPVTFTIGAIIESSNPRSITLARMTLLFVATG
jgi:hypothetical protein